MSAAAQKPTKPQPLRNAGQPVQTACGGTIKYSVRLPCAICNGQPVYFCLPACKADYDRDPSTSCLAAICWRSRKKRKRA